MISNMSITTDNVSQYQGSPVYGPDQTPFVDVEILNQGSGAAPYVDLQLGWAADMFSNIITPLPSGWVQVADATSGNVRTLTFRHAGTLDPGQRVASRFFWKLSNAQTMRPGAPQQTAFAVTSSPLARIQTRATTQRSPPTGHRTAVRGVRAVQPR